MSRFQRLRGFLSRNMIPCIPLFLIVHLILFTVFTLLYYKPTAAQLNSPDRLEAEHFSATSVACTFPVSGQYGQTCLYAFYLLIGGTVFSRKQEWLAVAMAASALTYSGVAAIHIWVLFSHNDKVSLSRTKSHCQQLQSAEETWDFLACNGVLDPDLLQCCNVVGIGLLASIPMALWSKTFQSTQSRPILIMWMFLMSSSHIFCVLTHTDPNRHYQICPSGITEAPPGDRYQAVENNDVWREHFISISTGRDNATEQRCIYSCFTTAGYIGRTPAEIGVYPVSPDNSVITPVHQDIGIAFWTTYTALGILSLGKITKDDSHLPDSGSEHRLLHGWKSSWCASSRKRLTTWHARIRAVARVLSILISLLYPAYVIILRQGLPEAEVFGSVGQWSAVAVICLTLFAALVSRVAQILDQRGRAQPSSPDEEDQIKEGWGHEVGYAS